MTNYIRSTFKIDCDSPSVTLPKVNEPLVSVYNYAGTGFLHGLALEFNSEKVEMVLTIDDEIVFNLDGEALLDALPDNMGDTKVIPIIKFDKVKDTFSCEFPSKLLFSSSVKIECRANYNNASRVLEKYFVFISKET